MRAQKSRAQPQHATSASFCHNRDWVTEALLRFPAQVNASTHGMKTALIIQGETALDVGCSMLGVECSQIRSTFPNAGFVFVPPPSMQIQSEKHRRTRK